MKINKAELLMANIAQCMLGHGWRAEEAGRTSVPGEKGQNETLEKKKVRSHRGSRPGSGHLALLMSFMAATRKEALFGECAAASAGPMMAETVPLR